LLITYWVWVSIAAVLNVHTVMLNGPFRAQS
jgi:tryptophan-rich sensory protein